MLRSILAGLFLLGGSLQAAPQPVPLGTFEGLLFSGSSTRQELNIDGGKLEQCELTLGGYGTIHTCKVVSGTLEVTGDHLSQLHVIFTKVSILETKDDGHRHYYYRGVAPMVIAGKRVDIAIKATLNWSPEAPDRLWGFLDLSDHGTRSGLEVYRSN